MLLDSVQKGCSFHSVGTDCVLFSHYVSGFSSLMLHKFVDAIRTLSNLVAYATNSKTSAIHLAHEVSQGFTQQTPLHEQAMALLAIAISLCPNARMDDAVMSSIKVGRAVFLSISCSNLHFIHVIEIFDDS